MDHSVIDEMATRLRSAGRWDNRLADRVGFYVRQVGALAAHVETTALPQAADYGSVRRPLEDYEACRTVLLAITTCRSTVRPDAASCLTLAVLLDRWEQEWADPPSNIRLMDVGGIAVEWDKDRGDRQVIIHHGVVI